MPPANTQLGRDGAQQLEFRGRVSRIQESGFDERTVWLFQRDWKHAGRTTRPAGLAATMVRAMLVAHGCRAPSKSVPVAEQLLTSRAAYLSVMSRKTRMAARSAAASESAHCVTSRSETQSYYLPCRTLGSYNRLYGGLSKPHAR
jgi:hypothetical protein